MYWRPIFALEMACFAQMPLPKLTCENNINEEINNEQHEEEEVEDEDEHSEYETEF